MRDEVVMFGVRYKVRFLISVWGGLMHRVELWLELRDEVGAMA